MSLRRRESFLSRFKDRFSRHPSREPSSAPATPTQETPAQIETSSLSREVSTNEAPKYAETGDKDTKHQPPKRQILSRYSSKTDSTVDDTNMRKQKPSGLSAAAWEALQDVPKLGLKSLKTLVKVEKDAALHEEVDDRDYIMEDVIAAAVKIAGDPIGDRITDSFLTTLYDDLQHPPEMYLGERFKYRSADGSNNSFLHPELGKAGQPYARTVKPASLQPACLPDPSVVFDSVLLRKQPTPHPNKISSVLFYLASIIIHDIFRTNHRDYGISDTSSYLDLAPLYGSNETEQSRVRTFQDGMLKPDCFSEVRLLSFPPGVGVLLIMFNRFHNHVAQQLVAINENGKFDKPSPQNRKTPEQYENDVFQTARLITCGLYINIVLIDYVRTILNLNHTDSNWQLNPRLDYPGGPALGAGNQVSAEFNLVYRWHAAISDRDDKWSQDLFAELFDGRKAEDVPQREFLGKLMVLETELTALEPPQRPFAKLNRQLDGTFKDEDLIEIITSSVDDCANAFGPRQVPAVMKAVEILGIQQARSWNLATLNEFRKHFLLQPHDSFSSITRDPEVAEQLKHLYGHPDNVELYPGLVVEDAKEPRFPGSGLCPSYTTSRAVLSDAVALVRGDRFYTTSYHPKLLTNWGYAEAQYDVDVNNGCCFYKLFLRAFPDHFNPDSVLIHYPLTVSSEMNKILGKLGKGDHYDFGSWHNPPQPEVISTYSGVKKILADKVTFHRRLGAALTLLNNKDHASLPEVHAISKVFDDIVLDDTKFVESVRAFFEQETIELLAQRSYKLANFREVDIVRDVVSIVPVRFCAEFLSIPTKTEAYPHGIVSENELRDILTVVQICMSDFDPVQSVILRSKSHKALTKLKQAYIKELDHVDERWCFSWSHRSLPETPLRSAGVKLIKHIGKSRLSPDDTFATMMVLGSSMAVCQSAVISEALDFMFQNDIERLPDMQWLSQQSTTDSEEVLSRYSMELARLSSSSIAYRVTVPGYIANGEKHVEQIELKAGESTTLSCKEANMDAIAFPEPQTVKLDRPLTSYLPLEPNVNVDLCETINRIAVSSMFRVILQRCPGVRPAKVWIGKSTLASLKSVPASLPGFSLTGVSQTSDQKVTNGVNGHAEGEATTSGTMLDSLKSVVMDVAKTAAPVVTKDARSPYSVYLSEKWDSLCPYPTTLKVNWDIESHHTLTTPTSAPVLVKDAVANGHNPSKSTPST
ncbi:hypothetical protein MBLNU457_g2565t1 [Dothideomycetes sp. NU457]